MQTLRFSPLSTASFREKRIARKPAAGAEPAERSTGARTAPHSYSLPGNYATLWAAAAGLSAAFQANPVLADTLSHPVVNTAQSFGSVGVVLVTASAAAYGGILILQQTLKSLQTQPSARSATQLSTDDHRRTGANSPSWALSTPTGPSSLASLSFQESPVKRASPSAPQRPPQQPQGPLSAPAQTSPTAEEPDKIRPLKPSAANVKPVDTAADIETPLPSRAIQNAIAEDSLFSPAKGKALQAVFRSSGHGCAGHARAAVDKVSDLLSQVAEPAPEPELVTAQPTLQAENLPAAQASEPMEQRQKAEDLAARFAETADSAGNLMEAGVRVALTVRGSHAALLAFLPCSQ